MAHGAGLSVVFPAWMKYVYQQHPARFIQFAMRVWDVEYDRGNPLRTAREGIQRIESFYRGSGMPVRLSDLGIGADKLELMANRVVYFDQGCIGSYARLGPKDVIEILKLAL